jgi:hypothetical protein
MERNENGYSNFLYGNRSQSRNDGNGSCPGTGDIWNGNGGMNGNFNNSLNGGINGNGTNGGCDGNQVNCAGRQLAMVYSPYQCWRMLYSPDEALKHGCLFEELYKPLEEY